MEMTQLLRLITVILSILTIPFSSYLTVSFIKEGFNLKFKKTRLNRSLQITAFLITAGSMIAGILSFLLFIGYDFESIFGFEISHYLFNSRNIIFAIGHLIFTSILTLEHVRK